MGDYGKFERSYLSQGRRYRALTRRYGYSMTKIAIFWKLPKIISTYFFVLSINHTCELELDIFFLGWDIIVQNFSSHSRSYKFYKCPHTTAAIFIFLTSFRIKLIALTYWKKNINIWLLFWASNFYTGLTYLLKRLCKCSSQ